MSLYQFIVLLLLQYTQVFHRVQYLALFFSLCILSLCLSLLTHTLSYTIHFLMTYNYIYLLPLMEYLSNFTLCSHVLVTSKLGQLRTCLNLMTTRLNSCLLSLRELSISITYLLQSLLEMHKIPSHSLWRIWILHYTVILLWMHMSQKLLIHATLNCVVWHLFEDSWQVLKLPHLYLLLLCKKLTTVTHCCLVLLMMWHPTFNGYRTMQLE